MWLLPKAVCHLNISELLHRSGFFLVRRAFTTSMGIGASPPQRCLALGELGCWTGINAYLLSVTVNSHAEAPIMQREGEKEIA